MIVLTACGTQLKAHRTSNNNDLLSGLVLVRSYPLNFKFQRQFLSTYAVHICSESQLGPDMNAFVNLALYVIGNLCVSPC